MSALTQRISIHGAASGPGKRLSAWNQRLLSGQYAVFFHDARTDLMLDERGLPLERDGSVAVFDELAEAQEYGRGVVEQRPVLRAEIFDSRGGVDGPLECIHSDAMRARFNPRTIARRDVWIAGVMLVGAVATATYAALGNWQSIWAYIIGTKLLIVGLFIGIRGVGWYLDERRDRST